MKKNDSHSMVRFRDLFCCVHPFTHPMRDDDVTSLPLLPPTLRLFGQKIRQITMGKFSVGIAVAMAMTMAGMGQVTGASYKWHITVDKRAQDCYTRPVLVVNGEFQPTLELIAGEELEVQEDLSISGPAMAFASVRQLHTHHQVFLPAVDLIQ